MIKYFFTVLMMLAAQLVSAADAVSVYELLYDEQETGTDLYRIRLLVSDNYMRIDTLGDDSGYVLFDVGETTIYSINHLDKTILVIKAGVYEKPDFKNKIDEIFEALATAPKIADRTVYNYKVTSKISPEDICLDVQLVPNLLPEVAKVLNKYQTAMVAQQVKGLTNTPDEFKTTCYMYNQIYNDGHYYKKGLPIQEWHSNGKSRHLVSYKKKNVSSELFDLVEGYREYSLD